MATARDRDCSCGSLCTNGTYQLGVAMATARERDCSCGRLCKNGTYQLGVAMATARERDCSCGRLCKNGTYQLGVAMATARDRDCSCGSLCKNGTYQLGVAMATARERAAATAAAGVAAAKILTVLSCDSSSLLFLWEVSKRFVKACQSTYFPDNATLLMTCLAGTKICKTENSHYSLVYSVLDFLISLLSLRASIGIFTGGQYVRFIGDISERIPRKRSKVNLLFSTWCVGLAA
jgi:hypothetical protein